MRTLEKAVEKLEKSVESYNATMRRIHIYETVAMDIMLKFRDAKAKENKPVMLQCLKDIEALRDSFRAGK